MSLQVHMLAMRHAAQSQTSAVDTVGMSTPGPHAKEQLKSSVGFGCNGSPRLHRSVTNIPTKRSCSGRRTAAAAAAAANHMATCRPPGRPAEQPARSSSSTRRTTRRHGSCCHTSSPPAITMSCSPCLPCRANPLFIVTVGDWLNKGGHQKSADVLQDPK